MATIFGGMAGKAEDALRKREQQINDSVDAATTNSTTDTERQKKNESAASGKTQLSTDDKKFKSK